MIGIDIVNTVLAVGAVSLLVGILLGTMIADAHHKTARNMYKSGIESLQRAVKCYEAAIKSYDTAEELVRDRTKRPEVTETDL